MTATRPRELIYFSYLPTATFDGMFFMYYALDDYSQFLIDLGFADNISDDTILQNIKKLMKHKDFKSSPKKPFTLMSSCGHDI